MHLPFQEVESSHGLTITVSSYHKHPFRKNKTSFIKNKIVVKVAPPIKSGTKILREIESLGIKKVT